MSGEVVQEYDRHLGAVNTITFVDENRRFVTTSDDKSLRVWEWYGLAVQSIPHFQTLAYNFSAVLLKEISCSDDVLLDDHHL